ncbi:FkbM family methyltransferase [Francisella philomiragia]|uniref:FkbM family methyltransferase n=1 Tax=Francisella philomiragia TaxID=28110 RepID=A0ABS1G9E7_9GAMM|nr:FkbM family methyltransferase [Francisella philomiragia]MBK2257744.1 FkbM family methyltransferase [Francisella philomiragia]MBK2301432.1 FkbM family methyltransferase [Francisella philomiragia]
MSLIDLNVSVNVNKEKLVDDFLNGRVDKYVLGRNETSAKLLDVVDFCGYIDDFFDGEIWNTKKVFKINQINNKNAIIVSCSIAIYPVSIIRKLEESGFNNILTVMDVVKYSNLNFNIKFLTVARQDLELNIVEYEKIYQKLRDCKSKQVLRDLVNFRLNFDLSYMREYTVDFKKQYFEDFLGLELNEVFADVGGYDGQTSIEFVKHCPKYKSIYIFEPSEANLILARDSLKNYKNINFISKGLSNKKETLRFNTNSGSASNLSEEGDVEIEVDTLDNLVKEKISFIKMDIEGAESLAIDGMKNHILKDHPKLAISVYHKPDDFWKIPEQIFNIRSDYDIYMRHYTEGTDETVMFFIPIK